MNNSTNSAGSLHPDQPDDQGEHPEVTTRRIPCDWCGNVGVRRVPNAAECYEQHIGPHPRLIACVACGDDAELVGAPGPSEPVDEYTCISCGRSFLSDGSITFEPVENPDGE